MLERFCTNMFARNSPREVKLTLWNESCQGGPIHPSEKPEAGLILNVWQEVVCNLHGHFSPIVGGEEVLIDILEFKCLWLERSGKWGEMGAGCCPTTEHWQLSSQRRTFLLSTLNSSHCQSEAIKVYCKTQLTVQIINISLFQVVQKIDGRNWAQRSVCTDLENNNYLGADHQYT